MIEQIAERRRNAVIVFTAHDDEGVGGSIQGREALQRRRRLPFRILLEHPIEQRQLKGHGIDERHLVAPCGERSLDEPRGFDPLAIRSHGTYEQDDLHADTVSRFRRGARDPRAAFARVEKDTLDWLDRYLGAPK